MARLFSRNLPLYRAVRIGYERTTKLVYEVAPRRPKPSSASCFTSIPARCRGCAPHSPANGLAPVENTMLENYSRDRARHTCNSFVAARRLAPKPDPIVCAATYALGTISRIVDTAEPRASRLTRPKRRSTEACSEKSVAPRSSLRLKVESKC